MARLRTHNRRARRPPRPRWSSLRAAMRAMFAHDEAHRTAIARVRASITGPGRAWVDPMLTQLEGLHQFEQAADQATLAGHLMANIARSLTIPTKSMDNRARRLRSRGLI